MKYRYDLHNLGREISDSVRNAVKLEDVQQLKGSIDDIVQELSQIGRDFSEPKGYRPRTSPPRVRASQVRTPRESPPQHEKTVVYDTKPIASPAPKAMKSIDGIVLTILGTVFASITAIITIVNIALIATGQFLLSSVTQTASSILGVIIAVGFCTSSFMLAKGTSLRRRVKRYSEYLKLFPGCKFYPVEQLAIVVDRSKNCVIRDLRRLIDSGKLPGAHLDADKSSIILDEETYNQYLIAEQKSRELSKKKKNRQSVPSQPLPVADTPAPEAAPEDAIITDGRAYIARIHAANIIIKGDVVSRKIDILESTVSKIFDYVSEHPEKQGDLRKLMNYYLPTTLKLLDAYSKFEAHAVRGENVSTAMGEIENALDTINLAFETLLDDLFEHEMYDISTDISALETMLAQEGLTAQDFVATNDNNTPGGLQ